jgi:hypothetical protein
VQQMLRWSSCCKVRCCTLCQTCALMAQSGKCSDRNYALPCLMCNDMRFGVCLALCVSG